MLDVEFVQFLTDWVTYAVDGVKARAFNEFEKCLNLMSLKAIKCDCGSIFVRYLH